MSVISTYNNLIFNTSDQLYRKFYDFNSLSGSFVEESLSSIRKRANLQIDYSDFKQHIYFNSAESKVVTTINKILKDYPIGISGSSYSTLSAVNVATIDDYIKNLNGFEQYILNYIGGVTGNTNINNIPSITASATTNNGAIVPLIYIQRDSNNTLINSQTALTASLYSLATAFDAGLNRIFLFSGTADHDVIFSDDGLLYKSNVVPESIVENINRGSNIQYLLPETFFTNDIDNVFLKYISVIGQTFDDIKLYIDQFANINHISYDSYNKVPSGLYQQLLAKHFGFELVDTMMYQDISSYLRKDSFKEPLYKITQKIWNRILNNLIYILKRKGSKESVFSLIRSYGLPADYININDYNFYSEPALQNKVEYKNVKALNFNQGGWIEFKTALSGSFSATTDFTFESRISTSALSNSHYIMHFQSNSTASGYSLYFNQQTRSLTFNVLGELGNSYISLSSATLNSALSSNNLTDISHITVFAMRRNNSLKLYATWIDETSGSACYNVLSAITSNISSQSISSNAKFTLGSSGNGVSSWNGIIYEVKLYNFALHDNDIEEHTRNFESLSFMNTVSGSLSGLIGQWKLKEGIVLTGIYNSIINTINTSITGAASGTLTSTNFYSVLENVRKETSYTNAGDFVDDNVDIYINSNQKFKKSNIINISFNPVSIVNNDIINVFGNINIPNLISDPSNFYGVSSVTQTYQGYPNASKSAQVVFSRYNSKINFNNYIQAINNLSPLINGIMNDIQQLLPVRSIINNRGVVVEPHILDRSRYIKKPDSLSEINQYKPSIYILDENLNFNNYSKSTSNNNAIITEEVSLSGKQYHSTDFYTLSSQQLLYLSKDSTTNVYRQINTDNIIYPFSQSVFNPEDTKILVSVNRNFIQNQSTLNNWQTSITGNIKLIRNSTGKIITSLEKTFRLNIPAKSINSILENYFETTIDDNIVDKNTQQYDFIINKKEGIKFLITRNSTFIDNDLGILYLSITNLLNGKTDELPIIIATDETAFGGSISIEGRNSNNNPSFAI